MPAAKYQPDQPQDVSAPTTSRALYSRVEEGPAQFEFEFKRESFAFIRSSNRGAELGTGIKPQSIVSSIEGQQLPEKIRPMVVVRRFPDPDYRFQLLQQWECVVRSVSAHEFVGVLYDVTDRFKAEEEATFPIEEVPDSDCELVEPGAVFYWSIGYRTSSTGQKDRVSQIRFRRLPSWTASERRDAAKEAAEFEELLGNE